MILRQTRVKAVDLSGAGWIQCFHVYRGSFHHYGSVGDFIKGSIKQVAFLPRYRRGKKYKPLRLGYIVRSLITQTKAPIRFYDNTRSIFSLNGVVLLRSRGQLKNKFIQGPLSRMIRRSQYEAMFSDFI